MKATIRNVLVLIGLTTSAGIARAQAPTASAQQKCRDARSVLPGCGVEAARVLAQEIPGQGRNANADSLRTVMLLAGNFRDATLFQALLALASSPGNTPESRVWSLLVIQRMINPASGLQYGLVTSPPLADGRLPCHGFVSVTDVNFDRPGDPLPSNAASLLHDLAVRLAADSAEPVLVRNAARCFYR
jgi:hypothetical protein